MNKYTFTKEILINIKIYMYFFNKFIIRFFGSHNDYGVRIL